MQCQSLLDTVFKLNSAALQVVINEVQPVNDNTITNSQGKTPSWVELYNPTPSSVSLEVGCSIT